MVPWVWLSRADTLVWWLLWPLFIYLFLRLLATVNKTKHKFPPICCSLSPLIGLTPPPALPPCAGLWCAASVLRDQELHKSVSGLRIRIKTKYPVFSVVVARELLKPGDCSRPWIPFVTWGSRLTQHVLVYIARGPEKRKCAESEGFWQIVVSECRTCDTRNRVNELGHAALQACRAFCLLYPYANDMDKVRLKNNYNLQPVDSQASSQTKKKKSLTSWQENKCKTCLTEVLLLPATVPPDFIHIYIWTDAQIHLHTQHSPGVTGFCSSVLRGMSGFGLLILFFYLFVFLAWCCH